MFQSAQPETSVNQFAGNFKCLKITAMEKCLSVAEGVQVNDRFFLCSYIVNISSSALKVIYVFFLPGQEQSTRLPYLGCLKAGRARHWLGKRGPPSLTLLTCLSLSLLVKPEPSEPDRDASVSPHSNTLTGVSCCCGRGVLIHTFKKKVHR